MSTLLHPMPNPEPEQLVRIEVNLPGLGARDVHLSEPEWKAHIVSERARDIGIRIALDAQRKTILHMVLSQGLALAVAGAAVGLAAALIVANLVAGLLCGVSPSDPLTLMSLTFVLIVVALAACYLPARRAMRVDPIVALREA